MGVRGILCPVADVAARRVVVGHILREPKPGRRAHRVPHAIGTDFGGRPHAVGPLRKGERLALPAVGASELARETLSLQALHGGRLIPTFTPGYTVV